MNKFVNYIILMICVTIGGLVPGLVGVEQAFGIWSFLGGFIGLLVGIVILVRLARR